MHQKKVTVGIVTHNRFDLLKIAIDSVLSQDYTNLEIIILDDASTDDTVNIAKVYPNILYKKTSKKSGQVLGRNYLMSISDATYYLSLDDDAFFMSSNIISDSVFFLEENQKIALLGYDILGTANKSTLFKGILPFAKADFVGCGHILRLSVIKKVDYYSPALGWGEEQDLSLKIHEYGYEIYGYPGLFVWHEMTPISRDYATQWRSQVKNVCSLVLRYYPIVLVFPFLVYKIVRLFFFSLLKLNLLINYILGVRDFLKDFKMLIINRQSVKFSTIKKYHYLLKLGK